MIKKALIILSIFTVLSCAQKEEETETVMLLHYFTGSLSQGINELADSLNQRQEDVQLVATPMEHEEFKINIRLQLDTENAPDLFSYWAGARTDYLAERNKITPIDQYLEDFPIEESFEKSVLEACSFDDRLYMLPLTQHYVGFFYNKETFRQMGLEEPESWEQLLISALKIQDSGRIPFALGSANRWPAQFWFDYLLLRTAGYDFRAQLMSGQSSYTHQNVLEVMELWKGLFNEQMFNPNFNELTWDQAADLVKRGEAAMTLMGTWIIPYLEEENLGFFPFPVMDDSVPLISLGPIDGALMSSNSTRHELSAGILKELASAEAQRAFNEKSGALAPHVGVSGEIYSDLQKEVIAEIEKSNYWAFNFDLATSPQRAELGLDFFVAFLDEPQKSLELLEALQEEVDQF